MMNHDEYINRQLDRMDKWEERRQRRVERDLRSRIVVDTSGTAVVEYDEEDEHNRLDRLHNQAMKLRLMWESRYLKMFEHEYGMFIYAGVVVDQRVGLRKSLSCREAQDLPKWTRALIREQVDEIIIALRDIDVMTATEDP